MQHEPHPQQSVDHALAKSYLAYFLASLIGLFVDSLLSIEFSSSAARPIAIIFLGMGPLLMLWAQYTSWRCRKEDHSAIFFHHGPYRYVRNPTHLGILILVTGYTLVSGSVVFFATTLLGFLLSNIFFSKYESFTHQQYGDHYKEYKSRTPRI